MGSDFDVLYLKEKLEFNSALEKYICLAVEKRTFARRMGKSNTF